jgi:hypothetical protein
MAPDPRARLLESIDFVSHRWREMSARAFENALVALVGRALSTDGYVVDGRDSAGDGLGGVAVRDTDNGQARTSIGIVVKKYQQALQVDQVQALIRSASTADCDRLLLVSASGFSRPALQVAEHFDPIAIELMDLERLRAWTVGLGAAENAQASCAVVAGDLCSRLATRMASDPALLDRMAWRDLEKLLRDILKEIGLDVTLTRASKYGGDDLVARFHAESATSMFYAEVKHWKDGVRPGQRGLRDFIKVLIQDQAERGLLLSPSGLPTNAFEGLAEIGQHRIRGKDGAKGWNLCRIYARARAGLWSPNDHLEDVVFEETLVRAPRET